VIWHRTGWDPEPAAKEFEHGCRRLWESEFDAAGDHTYQHQRKQRPAEPHPLEGLDRPLREARQRFAAWSRLIQERIEERTGQALE
jgi:hypothetical protein